MNLMAVTSVCVATYRRTLIETAAIYLMHVFDQGDSVLETAQGMVHLIRIEWI